LTDLVTSAKCKGAVDVPALLKVVFATMNQHLPSEWISVASVASEVFASSGMLPEDALHVFKTPATLEAFAKIRPQ
jgi:hypothetical protein